MANRAGGDAGGGIGSRLRLAREKRGLTLLQAAEKLHLDARMLEYLEAGDFARLGAPVYARGHLRRYAELVGESPRELEQLYAASEPAPGPDLTRIPHREGDADSRRLAMPALLVLGAFAFAGLGWWLWSLPTPEPHAVTPAAATGGTPAVSALTPGRTAEELVTAAAAAAHAPTPGGAHAAAAADARLALNFSAVSWVAVYDASGRRLFEGLNPPDSSRTLSGVPPLKVVLGNAPGVALRVNGQPVSLEGLVRRDGSARFLLDGAGHAAPLPRLVAHGD
jgi:cytoskeleton protein RodZ